ncbi:MAG: FadR family transcriptional regulator [Desulfobacteraceae bacterium]|jgi:GntR family transcriptional repressor for pyruvate dehydrogenase complex|nr:FadR family transcriptional regulator [Desulfobacteraceae bacterium]
MTLSLKPITPKRISDQVFEQLRELIFRGKLNPGDQLMPERELAEALNVSRTTVRNAINKLVVLGLLEHRQGQGTFVRRQDAAAQNVVAMAMESQGASVQDLLEVRMGLECNAAALAARRADEKDVQFLESSLKEMTRAIRSGRLGTQADTSFHMAVAYATKNPLQIYIMRNFYDFLFVGIRESLRQLYEVPGNLDLIVAQHTAISDAIRAHDEQAALEAMRRHITFVVNFFKSR